MAVVVCPSCGEENPDRFRLCGFCGAELTPAPAKQELRKTVSIVFSDLKGSTSLGEQLDPEALREVLRRYFEEMRAELERHGGRVEKYIGDAVMAVFGLPRVREDDALRAVRAAAGMQRALAELNEELERRWGVVLVNRTGVNTGELVVGERLAGDHLVTGDAVNVAARLEQAAGEYEVLIGEPTYRLVRDAVDVEEVEPLELKGKAEPVPAYRLLAVEDRGEGFARRSDAPLVGREAELAVLLGEFEICVLDRSCRCATILGDAGVGKSRLSQALTASVGDRAAVLRGRCLSYGEGITFWPIVEIVRDAAAIHEGDTADVARSKLLALVDDEAIVSRVVSAVGLSLDQLPVEELFWGIRRLFETLAASRPLVVVFDDIHWAEPVFLDLIRHLVDATEDAPLLLVCPARHELLERHPELGEQPRTTLIQLAPLNDEDAGRIVESLLGGVPLEPEMLARILQAAEGNPLYVEQMLSMLIDRQLLTRANGRWIAAGGAQEVSIPPSIQALLAARLDALTDSERGVLEPAAVAGTVFPQPAVEELVPDALRDAVPEHLGALTGKQFVRPDPGSTPEDEHYRFNHVLIRDAAYNGLLKRARAVLHERFVQWGDRVNRERGRETEFEEILGYHLEQAYRYLAELGPLDEHGIALGADAARRLASAGRRALARGDMRAAAGLLARAADLLPEVDARRLALMPDLGEALMESGQLVDAGEVLHKAVEDAAMSGEARVGAAARLLVLLLHLRSSDPEEWSELPTTEIEHAIEVFEQTGDHAGLAKAYRVLGWVHGTARRIGEAEDAARLGLEHARLAGDVREERANATAFALAGLLGPTDVPTAIARCEEILAQVTGVRRYEGWVTCILAVLEAMRGEFERAAELSRRGGETMQQLGEGGVLTAWPAMYGARVALLAGDGAAAERALREGFEVLERVGERYYLSTVAGLLAEALYVQGRLEEAEQLAATAREVSGEDDVSAQALWRSVLAKVHCRRGETAKGVPLAQEAVQLLLATDAQMNKIEALLDLGEVLRMAAEPHRWPLEEALRLAEQKGNLVAAGKARHLLGLASPAAS